MRKKIHKVLAAGFIILFTAAGSLTALASSLNQAGESWCCTADDGSTPTSQWLKDPGSGIFKEPDAGNALYAYSQYHDPAEYSGSPENSSDTGNLDGHAVSTAGEIINLVNAVRSGMGYQSLTVNDSLMKAAAVRGEEIVEHFSHTRPDGSASYTVLDDAGIDFLVAGENIAFGQETPEEVMDAWMKSESHRENILNSEYTEIGVDCYVHDGIHYWVQIFRLN